MTTDSGAVFDGAGGGPVRHIPVLLAEVLQALQPREGSVILDGTFGAGGYSEAILRTGARVIALDRDPAAIAGGRALQQVHGEALDLIEARFASLADHSSDDGLDGIVLDIGVSSMQLDQARRGFSFQQDGPLDMRMADTGPTAADIVNHLKSADLARIFGLLGEERQAGRIARAIVRRRAEAPFTTTRELAQLIETVNPRRAHDKIHPATRVFQALRVFVNEELTELATALFAAERVLKPGGRLVVVSFHSLEDRIVKRFFQSRFGKSGGASRHLPQVDRIEPSFEPVGKGLVTAGKEELADNPRARSAKLRAGMRTRAEAMTADASIFNLPRLPAVAAGEG